jgi:hypothetical protein
MLLDTLTPPHDVACEFDALCAASFAAASKEQMSRLMAYFDRAQQQAMLLGLQSQDFEIKRFAALLREALAAAQRCMLAAADRATGRELQ